MFIEPTSVIPEAVTLATSRLKSSNELLAYLREYQRREFQNFWRPNGTLRTVEEVNAELAAMDAASPGQSAQFFQAAGALAQLILALEPGSLGDADWYPAYAYTVDPVTFALRVA